MSTPIYEQIPQPGDILSDSQADILNNFTYLRTSLTRDHNISYNVNAISDPSQGLHNRVSFIGTGAANPGLAASSVSAVYSFVVASLADLYFKNTGTVGIKLTNSQVGAPVVASPGYTFLPGLSGIGNGLLVQWGSVMTGTPTIGLATVNFPIAFSAAPFCVQATANNASTITGFSLSVTSTAASNFTIVSRVSSNSGATSALVNILCFWMAIGPK